MFTCFQKRNNKKSNEWCNKVPVLEFNSGRYDLNVIKKPFVEHLAETTNKIKVAKNGNKTIFMHTRGFRFLDVIKYLGPGTSYQKWVKAYECKAVKSWLPYEWFETPEKLDYPGLPNYPEWYSKQKRGDIF